MAEGGGYCNMQVEDNQQGMAENQSRGGNEMSVEINQHGVEYQRIGEHDKLVETIQHGMEYQRKGEDDVSVEIIQQVLKTNQMSVEINRHGEENEPGGEPAGSWMDIDQHGVDKEPRRGGDMPVEAEGNQQRAENQLREERGHRVHRFSRAIYQHYPTLLDSLSIYIDMILRLSGHTLPLVGRQHEHACLVQEHIKLETEYFQTKEAEALLRMIVSTFLHVERQLDIMDKGRPWIAESQVDMLESMEKIHNWKIAVYKTDLAIVSLCKRVSAEPELVNMLNVCREIVWESSDVFERYIQLCEQRFLRFSGPLLGQR